MQDRPYQSDAHAAMRKEYLKGTNRQLITMATGTGKTVVFSRIPERMGDLLPGQQLILAHREELIDQAIAKMRNVNPGLKIDKEMADHRADPSTADCIVASVATLGRSGSSRIKRYNWQNVDKIITDEAHHSVADSYMNIYQASGILEPDSKRLLLGVTATSQRSDGKGLAALYQKIVFTYSLRQAIADGWLVEPRGYRVKTSTTLDHVKTTGGDYNTGQLAKTVNTPARNQSILKAWLTYGDGRQSIGFTADIQHAKDLALLFQEHGIAAEAIWGDDPDRADKLAQHRDRQLTVLFNCGILTEGYDDWQIGCVILGRPTKSNTLFTQMIGRATRLQDGTGNLQEAIAHGLNVKSDCIILDIVDASTRHSLITLPTLMGMSSNLDLKGAGIVKAVTKLEEIQQEYPHIDLSGLTDLSDLETFIESVNLFEVKFTPEVESNSQLSWHTAASGGYVLLLPNRDSVTIRQNILDKWEILGNIKGKRYRGERDSMEAAFMAADNVVMDTCAEDLRVLRREESWHAEPATEAQLKTIRRFFKGKAVPFDLTKGSASRLISAHLAGRA